MTVMRDKVTSESASDTNQDNANSLTAEWRKRRDEAIRHYHQLGLYPIPLSGKRPYRKQWQKLKSYEGLDTESLLNLFSATDNVGLLCGIQMGDGKYLVGIDYDNEALWRKHLEQANDNEGFDWLMGGPVVETGSGKRHHYVLSDSPEKIVFADASGKHHAGEVQGAGTQLVAPPSIHPTTGKEYRWLDESWQDIHFVGHLTLQASYPAKADKRKFKENSNKEEKQRFSSSDAGDFGNDSTFYDYSTIDFIALFQSRGWVIEDKGDTVIVLCPNRAQHTENSDGTSSTVILRTPAGGQRFKCLHGHCEHLSDRDNLVDSLGGPSILEDFAKKRDSSAGSQESASKETTAPPTTSWLRLDTRSGLYHVRQIEAANAFLETGVQLDDPELEQKLLNFLESPSGGEDISTLGARTLADVIKLVRTKRSTGEKVQLRQACDIPMESIQWLWKDWLAQGKLHLLAGQPGTGKTTIAMQMAATVSKGGTWPDGSTSEQGKVLIWSGEDDPQDTLVPRLKLAGADLQQIYFVENVRDEQGSRSFDPSKDLRMLTVELEEIGQVSLFVADPLVSVVGGDSHRNSEVRRALQPLVDLAEAQKCAVLGITHYSKSTQVRDPLDRVTGSVGFAAVARIVLGTAIVQNEVDSDDERLLIRLKSNIATDRDGFTYTLEQEELKDHEGIFNSRIRWGEAIYGSARQILEKAESQQQNDSRRQPREEALEFLRDLLSDSGSPVKVLREEVNAAGLTWATIRRAADELNVIKRKVGGPKEKSYWEWSLPEEPEGFTTL